MRKRIIALICVLALTMGLMSGCALIDTGESVPGGAGVPVSTGDLEGIQASPEFYAEADMSVLNGKKIGVTIQSLQNAYWAGVMQALEEAVKAAGGSITIVACNDSSATQIGQVENFISSGCDLIMMHPSDAAALEDVSASARNKGIKTMCWDDPMTNTDGNWVLNNTDLGRAIGEAAGAFIMDHYDPDNQAQIAMINYPQTTILLEREEGIIEGLENTAAGCYQIVSSQAGLDANQAQTAMETILQRYPDCKVVTGIGSGAMIGTDEALQISTGSKIPEEMGVFTADVTKQQLEHLMDPNYPARIAVGFEGSDMDTGNACAAMFALILSDSLESQNVFRGLTLISAENAPEIMKGMK